MGGNQSKGGGNSGNNQSNDSSKYKGVDTSQFTGRKGQKLDTIVINNYDTKSTYPSNSNNQSGINNVSNSVSLSNFSGGNVSSGKSPYYLDLDSHFLSLHNKFSSFNVGYGKIHTDPIIGGNPNYKGTYIDEIINTVQTEVSKSTLHYKLVINLYNRGAVDTDLYTLGSKLSGVTLNLCLFDLQKNNITTLGANNFIHFFKFQNINQINISSNKLGDAGCGEFSAALAAGWLPNLHAIDLSDNQITNTGHGYIAKALNAVSQAISVTFTKIKDVSKTTLKETMKGMVFIAKNNGISTKEMLTTDETIEYCKKGTFNVGVNVVGGYLKCTSKVVKAYNYKDITIGDVASEILGLYAQPIKAVLNFTCITQNTVFSVVDEDFANCLVGVDSLLNE